MTQIEQTITVCLHIFRFHTLTGLHDCKTQVHTGIKVDDNFAATPIEEILDVAQSWVIDQNHLHELLHQAPQTQPSWSSAYQRYNGSWTLHTRHQLRVDRRYKASNSAQRCKHIAITTMFSQGLSWSGHKYRYAPLFLLPVYHNNPAVCNPHRLDQRSFSKSPHRLQKLESSMMQTQDEQKLYQPRTFLNPKFKFNFKTSSTLLLDSNRTRWQAGVAHCWIICP